MNAIDAAIFLGERLGRERALQPDETDALQAVIRIDRARHGSCHGGNGKCYVWTPVMDRRLQQERHRNPRSYAPIIAAEFNVSPMAARTRAKKLKAMKGE